MLEAVKEMSKAYQLAAKRIDVLENCCQEYAERIKTLEIYHQEDTQKIKMLEKKDELLELQAIRNESKNQAFEKEINSNECSCNQSLSLVNQSNNMVSKIRKDMQEFEDRFCEMEKRANRDHLEVVASLQDINVAVAIASGDKVIRHEKPSECVMKYLEDKVLEVERVHNILMVQYSELEIQLHASLVSTHNGALLWKIPEVRRRIRDAKIGRVTSIYSPPFYTGRNGYKMCIRAYLNGDGSGEGTHLSIYFVLMMGKYDALLQWPFESKVSLILVDQTHHKHLVQSFKPNPNSCSFQRPKTDMNVASGCPEFADLSILDNTSYVKDDTIYIKGIVDISKIFHP